MSLRSFCVIPGFAGLVGLAALFLGCTPKIGNSCTLSTDCSSLGDRLCDTTQPNGYCTVFNCEPDQCPNAICVAFDPTLDPACGSADNGRAPRFEASFCLAPCSSNSDCRDQYECVDLSVQANQVKRNAQVVDLGAADGGLGFGVCMAATCGDGIQDAAETDVDCGGPDCHMCNNRQHCSSGTDCYSGICTGGTCVGQTCSDHQVDGTETDVDCGGPDCVPCAPGRNCQGNGDCANASCASSLCQPGNCTDNTKNAAETDVDCGGPVCGACADGLKCHAATDCTSQFCVPTGTCVTTTACKKTVDCAATSPSSTCFEGF